MITSRKNVIFGIVLILLGLLALSAYIAKRTPVVEESPVIVPIVATSPGPEKTPMTTSTASASNATSTISIDWTRIGKDRLYTEEEGRYENLSDEEKVVVQHSVDVWLPGTWVLYDKPQLLSLYEGFVLLRPIGGGGAPNADVLIDARNSSISAKQSQRDVIKMKLSSTTLVYVEDQQITYYKPGYYDFQVLPNSILPNSQSYTYRAGMGFTFTDATSTMNSITVGIYPQDTIWGIEMGGQSEKPKPIEKRIFLIE